mgnify:FL=1
MRTTNIAIKNAVNAILDAEIAVNVISRNVKQFELGPIKAAIKQLNATREFVESFPTFIPSLKEED